MRASPLPTYNPTADRATYCLQVQESLSSHYKINTFSYRVQRGGGRYLQDSSPYMSYRPKGDISKRFLEIPHIRSE